MNNTISLIGYRGTGKSTVGRLLARRIGYRCLDTDDEIERRAGMTVTRIFESRGESAFRDLESAVVEEFAGQPQLVLSLGGGAILRAENRRLIRAAGPVIWLRASVTTIAQRIGIDPASSARRPNLTSQGGIGEIEQLLEQRLPLYQACASLQLDTDHSTPAELVDSMIDECGLSAG